MNGVIIERIYTFMLLKGKGCAQRRMPLQEEISTRALNNSSSVSEYTLHRLAKVQMSQMYKRRNKGNKEQARQGKRDYGEMNVFLKSQPWVYYLPIELQWSVLCSVLTT